MSRQAKQSFLHGAMILIIANGLVKVIGAFFKIPLTYLLGDSGMGYFTTAYTLYTFMFVIATSGFPVAVSKLVAEAVARNNHREADKIFRIAFALLGIIGFIGTAALYIFADNLAELFGSSRAADSIRAIAPAVLFVALTSSFRGYFQGHQNMYPTAVSEVFEALGKPVVGYTAAFLLIGHSLSLASAGAVLGVSCGAVFSTVYLAVIYFRNRRNSPRLVSVSTRGAGTLAADIMRISIPVMIGASVTSVTNVADLFTIMNRLQSSGYSEEAANALYGSYAGYAIPMFNLPLTCVTALSMSIVPAIASALEMKMKQRARHAAETVVRITVMFALPAAVGMSIMSGPILSIVYKNTNAEHTLKILAAAILFASLISVTTAVLQAYGRMMVPVVNTAAGGVVKVIMNYLFIPVYGINAAPAATVVCYITIAVLNLAWLVSVSGARLKLTDFVLKPAAACFAMAVCVLFLYRYMTAELSMSVNAAGFGAIIFGCVVYGVMMFVTKMIRREELEMLPKGDKIADFLEKIYFLR